MKMNKLIDKYYNGGDPEIVYIITDPEDKEMLAVRKKHPDMSIQTTIKPSTKTDIMIVDLEGLDGKEVAVTLNKLEGQVDVFIIRAPKQFDFNAFIQTSVYNHADIYHIRKLGYYYICINSRRHESNS